MATHRPAVRIVCLDDRHRVLLLRWRDPYDGHCLWEPPGGGVDPGEGYLDAARRELVEETGLPAEAIADAYVLVERDVRWKGVRYVGPEAFFLARFAGTPALRRDGLLAYESETLQGHDWVAWDALDALADPLEPPQLVEVLADLDPTGPWAAR